MPLFHPRNGKEMTELVVGVVCVVGLSIVLPFLAYFVSRSWEIGRLSGKAAYCKHRKVSDDERCRRLIRDGLRTK